MNNGVFFSENIKYPPSSTLDPMSVKLLETVYKGAIVEYTTPSSFYSCRKQLITLLDYLAKKTKHKFFSKFKKKQVETLSTNSDQTTKLSVLNGVKKKLEYAFQDILKNHSKVSKEALEEYQKEVCTSGQIFNMMSGVDLFYDRAPNTFFQQTKYHLIENIALEFLKKHQLITQTNVGLEIHYVKWLMLQVSSKYGLDESILKESYKVSEKVTSQLFKFEMYLSKQFTVPNFILTFLKDNEFELKDYYSFEELTFFHTFLGLRSLPDTVHRLFSVDDQNRFLLRNKSEIFIYSYFAQLLEQSSLLENVTFNLGNITLVDNGTDLVKLIEIEDDYTNTIYAPLEKSDLQNLFSYADGMDSEKKELIANLMPELITRLLSSLPTNELFDLVTQQFMDKDIIASGLHLMLSQKIDDNIFNQLSEYFCDQFKAFEKLWQNHCVRYDHINHLESFDLDAEAIKRLFLVAVEYGSIQCISYLLDQRIISAKMVKEKRIMTNDTLTPFIFAIEKGYIDVVCLLIKKFNLSTNAPSNFYTGSPLESAIIAQQEEIAKLLITHPSFDIKKESPDLYDNLCVLAYEYQMPDLAFSIAKMMHSNKMRIMGSGFNEDSFIKIMMSNGYTEQLFQLIQYDYININCQQGRNGAKSNTPLHFALLHEKEELALKLIDANASLNLKNHDGDTPLMLAVFHRNLAVVNALLKKREEGKEVSINAVNKSGHTALHYAIANKDIELVERLLSQSDILISCGHNILFYTIFHLNDTDLTDLRILDTLIKIPSIIALSVCKADLYHNKIQGVLKNLIEDCSKVQLLRIGQVAWREKEIHAIKFAEILGKKNTLVRVILNALENSRPDEKPTRSDEKKKEKDPVNWRKDSRFFARQPTREDIEKALREAEIEQEFQANENCGDSLGI